MSLQGSTLEGKEEEEANTPVTPTDKWNVYKTYLIFFMQELDLSFNEDLASLAGIKTLVELTSLNIDGCAVRHCLCLFN